MKLLFTPKVADTVIYILTSDLNYTKTYPFQGMSQINFILVCVGTFNYDGLLYTNVGHYVDLTEKS